MASSFYGCKGGSFLFSARIVKANERGRMRRLGGGEGTFLQKGSLSPSKPPPLPPKTFTLIESPLAAFPGGEGRGNPPDVGKSRATKNREWPAFPVSAIAPAEERKGEVNRNMTSWAVFTFGWQVPADAKSGKNGSEMPPHTFSQEVHGGRFGEGASGRRPSPSASAIRLSRPQSCGRRAFRVPCGESRCSTRHPCGSR